MARIKFEDRLAHGKFQAIHQISRANGETNDCTVKAIALVTGATYVEAHAALAKHGRKNGKGCCQSVQNAALRDLGYKLTAVSIRDRFISKYPGTHKNLKSATTHHMKRFNEVWADGKTYLVYVRAHVAAVVDGVNLDWTVGRAKRVLNVFEVNKVVP